jgi:hypothetical protein
MPDDTELRAALLAFCHAAREANPKSFESDEHFAEYVEFVLNGRGPNSRAECFRVWHIMDGRYPTYAELYCPPKALIPEHLTD